MSGALLVMNGQTIFLNSGNDILDLLSYQQEVQNGNLYNILASAPSVVNPTTSVGSTSRFLNLGNRKVELITDDTNDISEFLSFDKDPSNNVEQIVNKTISEPNSIQKILLNNKLNRILNPEPIILNKPAPQIQAPINNGGDSSVLALVQIPGGSVQTIKLGLNDLQKYGVDVTQFRDQKKKIKKSNPVNFSNQIKNDILLQSIQVSQIDSPANTPFIPQQEFSVNRPLPPITPKLLSEKDKGLTFVKKITTDKPTPKYSSLLLSKKIEDLKAKNKETESDFEIDVCSTDSNPAVLPAQTPNSSKIPQVKKPPPKPIIRTKPRVNTKTKNSPKRTKPKKTNSKKTSVQSINKHSQKDENHVTTNHEVKPFIIKTTTNYTRSSSTPGPSKSSFETEGTVKIQISTGTVKDSNSSNSPKDKENGESTSISVSSDPKNASSNVDDSSSMTSIIYSAASDDCEPYSVQLPGGDSSKPLGSSENPIQLVQQGSTFQALQPIQEKHIEQIASLLQQRKIHCGATYEEMFDPRTNVKIVYKVIKPEDLAKPPDVNNQKYSLSDDDEEIDVEVTVVEKSDDDEEKTKISTASEGSLNVDILDMNEEAKFKRPIASRTRSGRISRPPKHMLKDFGQLSPKSKEVEESLLDKEAKLDLPPPVLEEIPLNDRKKKMNFSIVTRLRYTCATCGKLYMGSRMEAHLQKFPNHRSCSEEDEQDSARTVLQSFSALKSLSVPPETTIKEEDEDEDDDKKEQPTKSPARSPIPLELPEEVIARNENIIPETKTILTSPQVEKDECKINVPTKSDDDFPPEINIGEAKNTNTTNPNRGSGTKRGRGGRWRGRGRGNNKSSRTSKVYPPPSLDVLEKVLRNYQVVDIMKILWKILSKTMSIWSLFTIISQVFKGRQTSQLQDTIEVLYDLIIQCKEVILKDTILLQTEFGCANENKMEVLFEIVKISHEVSKVFGVSEGTYKMKEEIIEIPPEQVKQEIVESFSSPMDTETYDQNIPNETQFSSDMDTEKSNLSEPSISPKKELVSCKADYTNIRYDSAPSDILAEDEIQVSKLPLLRNQTPTENVNEINMIDNINNDNTGVEQTSNSYTLDKSITNITMHTKLVPEDAQNHKINDFINLPTSPENNDNSTFTATGMINSFINNSEEDDQSKSEEEFIQSLGNSSKLPMNNVEFKSSHIDKFASLHTIQESCTVSNPVLANNSNFNTFINTNNLHNLEQDPKLPPVNSEQNHNVEHFIKSTDNFSSKTDSNDLIESLIQSAGISPANNKERKHLYSQKSNELCAVPINIFNELCPKSGSTDGMTNIPTQLPMQSENISINPVRIQNENVSIVETFLNSSSNTSSSKSLESNLIDNIINPIESSPVCNSNANSSKMTTERTICLAPSLLSQNVGITSVTDQPSTNEFDNLIDTNSLPTKSSKRRKLRSEQNTRQKPLYIPSESYSKTENDDFIENLIKSTVVSKKSKTKKRAVKRNNPCPVESILGNEDVRPIVTEQYSSNHGNNLQYNTFISTNASHCNVDSNISQPSNINENLHILSSYSSNSNKLYEKSSNEGCIQLPAKESDTIENSQTSTANVLCSINGQLDNLHNMESFVTCESPSVLSNQVNNHKANGILPSNDMHLVDSLINSSSIELQSKLQNDFVEHPEGTNINLVESFLNTNSGESRTKVNDSSIDNSHFFPGESLSSFKDAADSVMNFVTTSSNVTEHIIDKVILSSSFKEKSNKKRIKKNSIEQDISRQSSSQIHNKLKCVSSEELNDMNYLKQVSNVLTYNLNVPTNVPKCMPKVEQSLYHSSHNLVSLPHETKGIVSLTSSCNTMSSHEIYGERPTKKQKTDHSPVRKTPSPPDSIFSDSFDPFKMNTLSYNGTDSEPLTTPHVTISSCSAYDNLTTPKYVIADSVIEPNISDDNKKVKVPNLSPLPKLPGVDTGGIFSLDSIEFNPPDGIKRNLFHCVQRKKKVEAPISSEDKDPIYQENDASDELDTPKKFDISSVINGFSDKSQDSFDTSSLFSTLDTFKDVSSNNLPSYSSNTFSKPNVSDLNSSVSKSAENTHLKSTINNSQDSNIVPPKFKSTFVPAITTPPSNFSSYVAHKSCPSISTPPDLSFLVPLPPDSSPKQNHYNATCSLISSPSYSTYSPSTSPVSSLFTPIKSPVHYTPSLSPTLISSVNLTPSLSPTYKNMCNPIPNCYPSAVVKQIPFTTPLTPSLSPSFISSSYANALIPAVSPTFSLTHSDSIITKSNEKTVKFGEKHCEPYNKEKISSIDDFQPPITSTPMFVSTFKPVLSAATTAPFSDLINSSFSEESLLNHVTCSNQEVNPSTEISLSNMTYTFLDSLTNNLPLHHTSQKSTNFNEIYVSKENNCSQYSSVNSISSTIVPDSLPNFSINQSFPTNFTSIPDCNTIPYNTNNHSFHKATAPPSIPSPSNASSIMPINNSCPSAVPPNFDMSGLSTSNNIVNDQSSVSQMSLGDLVDIPNLLASETELNESSNDASICNSGKLLENSSDTSDLDVLMKIHDVSTSGINDILNNQMHPVANVNKLIPSGNVQHESVPNSQKKSALITTFTDALASNLQENENTSITNNRKT